MPTPCYTQVVIGPDVAALNPNNVTIPLTGKHNITSVPVYADDFVSIMYYEHTLTFDSIIYDVADVVNMEVEVARMRAALNQVGNQIYLINTGVGDFGVIVSERFPTTAGSPAIYELSGGPYPQQISVEAAVGNKALMISGQIIFRTQTCTFLSGVLLSNPLLQYNYEFDLDIDDQGNFSLSGKYSFTFRQAQTNIATIQSLVKAITKTVVNGPLTGYKRKFRTSKSRDQRTVHVSVNYTEIKSPNAFFINTSNIQATDSMESDLMTDGFYKWDRTISATITLPWRIHKLYALEVFRRIVTERLRNLKLLSKDEPVAQFAEAANQVLEAPSTTNWYIPTSISFTNELYDNTISFSYSYLVCTDLEHLQNTNMFAQVNTEYIGTNNPKKKTDQWITWINGDANRYGVAGVQVTGSDPPQTIDPCTGTTNTTNHFVTKAAYTDEDQRAYYEDDPDMPTPRTIVPEGQTQTPESPGGKEGSDIKFSWIDYKTELEVMQTNNNMQVSFLQPTANAYYQANEAVSPLRSTVGFQMDGKIVPTPPTYPNKTISRGPSQNQIRFTGYAVRAWHKIPTPAIITVNNLPVERTAMSKVVHKQIGTGKTPIYLAMWDIVYNVNTELHSTDIAATIKTSGNDSSYV